MLTAGTLGGTGRLVILPVDQGVEHGPARSFAPNPAAYDPRYHFELAIEAGCNARCTARLHRGRRPRVRRTDPADPQAQQPRRPPGRARSQPGDHARGDALRLGCVAVGFTIYPGSAHRLAMYEQIRTIAEEARPTARGGDLVIPAAPASARRDRARRHRLRGPHRRPAGRSHHQGEATERPSRAGRRQRCTKSRGGARHAGRAGPSRRAGLLRRPSGRDLLGWSRQQGRAVLRRDSRHPRRRRIRVDHRAQLVSAKGAEALTFLRTVMGIYAGTVK